MNVFKISVIMPIHNHSGDHIKKAIKSVIKQDINFEENVEIILVNDGSTLSTTEKFCLEYHEKYPNNIKYSYQQKEGYNVACNNGIKFAEGKYITILDSYDKFREDSLRKVYEFFEEHYDETDVVIIPIKPYSITNKNHEFNFKFNRTRVVDLEKYNHFIQLSPLSAFFKREQFENVQFDENIPNIEDTSFINKMLLEKRTLGIVREGKYFFKERNENRDVLDQRENNVENYLPKCKYHFNKLIEYYHNNLGKIPLFIQNTLLYQLKEIIANEDISVLSLEEQEELYSKVYYILQNISDTLISRNTEYSLELKSICFYIKYPDKKVEVFNGAIRKEVNQNWILYEAENRHIDILNNHAIAIDIIDIKHDQFIINGYMKTFFEENTYEIQAVKIVNDEEVEIIEPTPLNYPNRDKKHLGRIFNKYFNFDIRIPINTNENSKIKLRIKYNNITFYPKVMFREYAKLSQESYYSQKDKYIIKFNKSDPSFSIDQFNSFKLIELEHENIEYLTNHLEEYPELTEDMRKEIINYRLKYASLFLQYYDKKIWLFEDRITLANDNAEALYQYAVKQDDNIEKYFVLSKDSCDFERLQQYGNIIEFGSDEHKLLYLFADKIISSQASESSTNPFWKVKSKFMNGLLNANKYFIQNGILLHDISNWLHRYDKNLSLVTCSTQKEYETLLSDKYGFDEDTVQLLGTPRYDYLENNSKKQIVFAPTWRNNLENRIDLVNSDYYKNIVSLLNNRHLINYAKQAGYEIIFKPHPNLLKLIDEFELNEYVTVDTSSNYNEIINTSKILITDYSSIACDFAYLKKPIIYYRENDEFHFDIENSYFDYETMGFGKIVTNKKELVNTLSHYISNDCVMEDMYKKRVDEFFKYADKNNCKRVYDWIKEN